MNEEVGRELLKEVTSLNEIRDKVILPVWKQITEVLIPELSDMDGTSTMDALLAPGFYNGQGRAYLETTTNAIYSMICGPGTNWIQFGIGDDIELMRDIEVRRYFDDLRIIVLNRLAQDGFYDVAKPAIKHAISIGTTVVTVTREPDSNRIDYIQWHPGDYAISTDKGGRNDGIVIKQKPELKDLMVYPDLPDALQKDFMNGNGDKEIVVWFYFRKNIEGEPTEGLEINFPYTLYQILEDGAIISATGMHSMPGPAWAFEKTPRLDYGLCPGYYILRDLLQSNKIRKIILKETEKESNPPLWVPRQNEQFFTDPGSINYFDGDGSQMPRRVFDPANLQNAQIANQEIDFILRSHLLVDFFSSLTNKTNRKTAQEVQGMQSEMGAQAAPLVYSVENNFLRPVIKRTLLHLHEMGELPEPPSQLKKVAPKFPMEIQFIGPLSIANRYLYKTAQAHRILNESIMPIAQLDPEGVKDSFNTTEFLKMTSEGIGGGYRILYSDAEIEQRKLEREQKEQQQVLLQQQQMLLKDGGTAPEAGSPLEQGMQQ